ncbi:MAG: BamA/TamA family outer membrane protein [Xanthomonadales bacterium]|jgi:translocation and assembly module TamA|nr:BamA/TamA family outer membrane protein [Xanthomonadales bacterium]
MPLLLALCLVFCLGQPLQVRASDLELVVRGVDGALAENVRAHVGSLWVSGAALSSERRRQELVDREELRAAQALRPLGYYQPTIQGRLEQRDNENWTLFLDIERGPPVRVKAVNLDIRGPGAGVSVVRDWVDAWPLPPGRTLDQGVWTTQKAEIIDVLESEGFLAAEITESTLALDLVANEADLTLQVESGVQFVMGAVEYDQDLVRPVVLQSIPRFSPGDPYSVWAVERLRQDLWRTGYFGEIDVREERIESSEPPRVDFRVLAGPRNRITHQGTLGYGTDSEFRTQYNVTRHLLSDRGDSITAGLGWQQRDQELRVAMEYRLPRRDPDARKYWVVNTVLRQERRELFLESDGEETDRITRTDIQEYLLRLGHGRMRGVGRSQEWLVEHWFMDLLAEEDGIDSADLGSGPIPIVAGDTPVPERSGSVRSLAFGFQVDLPVIEGRGFRTVGHHERAWAIASSDSLGSDVEFQQVYFSSRWNRLLTPRLMLFLRGEAGYTNADVDEFVVAQDGEESRVELTTLPNTYRFRAGGSRSVRGYDFETLSNNGFGSNNILTASVELEYNVVGDWAGAVFYDVGNAFNDWSNPGLKQGWGVGVRWYTLAGPIRLDVAQALDLEGDPWTFHLTIGTPLL